MAVVISVAPNPAVRPTTVDIIVAGLTPGSRYNIRLDGHTIATAQATSSRNLAVGARILSTASLGTHTVQARDSANKVTLKQVTFTVAIAPPVEPPPVEPPPVEPPPEPEPPPVTGTFPQDRPALTNPSTPSVAKPAKGATITDPVWGTKVTRVGGDGQRHAYARQQPWSRGDKLLWFPYGGGAIIDTVTGTTIRTGGGAVPSDFAWLNLTDDVGIGGEGTSNVLRAVNARTGAQLWRVAYSQYTALSTRGEGRQSADDRYIALQGSKSGTPIVVVVDLTTRGVVAEKTLSYEPNNTTISPSGRFVLINGTGNGVHAWDWAANSSRQLTGYGQHGDVVRDADGSDLYVQSDPRLSCWELATGAQRFLLPSASVFSESHVSGTNIDRPGWVYVSQYSATSGLGRDQVVAVKTDGSGTVEVFAHAHHGSSGAYEHQPQAVASRDGTKVMFASEWGGSTSSAYVARA